MSQLRVHQRWLQILISCKNHKLLLQSLQNIAMWFLLLQDATRNSYSVWLTSCANLKTRAFHLGFSGLTSHKWFLKQEELTPSLLSAFKFPDCTVKQRESVSAHIHRAILVGRDILRSPGQATLRAGPPRSGCSGLCRYFSICKDSPFGFCCYSVWPHYGDFFLFYWHLPSHANTLCLLPPELCALCTFVKRRCLALLYL